jgi:hypothetical protein
MFISVDLQTIFHALRVGIFTDISVRNLTCLASIVNYRKPKKNFRRPMLFYVPQKITLTSYIYIAGSRASVVDISTGYGLDGSEVGVRVPVGSRIFSPPRRSDRLWGPRSLLSNGYRVLFPRVVRRPGRELVPRSRKCGSIHPLPIRLHIVVYN